MAKMTALVVLFCGIALATVTATPSPTAEAVTRKPTGDDLAPWHRWWDRIAFEVAQQGAAAEIEALLETQSAQWTAGDLDGFCSVYATNATFLSPSGLTRGRAQILARYKRRYDTAQKRGRLSLAIVELWLVPSTHGRIAAASAVLRWHLARNGQADASGLSLIVLRPTSNGWLIDQDASM